MKNSKNLGKERLVKMLSPVDDDLAQKLEPYRGALSASNTQYELERKPDKNGDCFPFPEEQEKEIDRLKQELAAKEAELALVQQQLIEAQGSADDWRYRYIQLAEAGQ